MSVSRPIESSAVGWVYVLSHPQMTALKVGFTLRSVPERVEELSGTAVPGAFVWEYGVLVENPESIEKKAHRILASHRVSANREFFSCELSVAVSALISATQHRPPRKTHDRAQIEQRAASLSRQQEALSQWKATEEARISESSRVIRAEAEALKPKFVWFWLGHTFLIALAIDTFAPVKTEVGLWLLSAIIGAVSAFIHHEHVHEKRKSSSSIQGRLNQLEEELQEVRSEFAKRSASINRGEAPAIQKVFDARAPREPQSAPPPQDHERGGYTRTLEQGIAAAEARVIREIPTKFFRCDSCSRTVNLNAKAFCSQVRCPAKLLTDA